MLTTYVYLGTFVKWIERLHAEGKQDSLQMLATQFHLAVVLCHESIHMIHMANNCKSHHRIITCRCGNADQDGSRAIAPLAVGRL